MDRKGTAWLAIAVVGLLLVALAPQAAFAAVNDTDDDRTSGLDDESGTTGSDGGESGNEDDAETGAERGDYYLTISSRNNGTEDDEGTSTSSTTASSRTSASTRTTATGTSATTRTSSSALDDENGTGVTSGDDDGTEGLTKLAGSSPDAVAPVEHEGTPTFFVILLEDNEVRPATEREMDVMVDMLESGEPLLEDTMGDMEQSSTRPVPESVMTNTGGDSTVSGSGMGTAGADGVGADDGTGVVRDDTAMRDDGTTTDTSNDPTRQGVIDSTRNEDARAPGVSGESIDNEEDDLGTGTQEDDGVSGTDDGSGIFGDDDTDAIDDGSGTDGGMGTA